MIDVLIEQLNAFQPNMEALREYSVVISKLMDFLTISKIILIILIQINLVISARRDDIIKRKKIVDEQINSRLNKIKIKEETDEKRKNDLISAKEVLYIYL